MSERTPEFDIGDILLIEDNPGDARLVEEMLAETELNPTLHTVPDGSEALNFLHRSGEYSDAPRPDAILLDLHLPQTDGDEVISKMNDEVRDIPLIVYSGSQMRADHKLGDIKDDVKAIVEKPPEPEELEELAESLQE